MEINFPIMFVKFLFTFAFSRACSPGKPVSSFVKRDSNLFTFRLSNIFLELLFSIWFHVLG